MLTICTRNLPVLALVIALAVAPVYSAIRAPHQAHTYHGNFADEPQNSSDIAQLSNLRSHDHNSDSPVTATTFGVREWIRTRTLDEPTCILLSGDNDTVAFYQGTVPGMEYDVWFRPVSCAGCSAAYPFRIDSLNFVIVLADGSPADTVSVRTDVVCASPDPEDSCSGPGLGAIHSITTIYSFSSDPEDGLPALHTVSADLDSVYVAGPFFLRFVFLGNTVDDPQLFKPAFGIDGGSSSAPCVAWSNLTGTMAKWDEVWPSPTPGYPLVAVLGECNTSPDPPPESCPVLCASQRIGSNLTLYEPNTTEVWNYYRAGEHFEIPYKPLEVHCSLYWYSSGLPGDSVLLAVNFGCARFGSECCAPSEVLCESSAWVRRSTGLSGEISPIVFDLSLLSCCLVDNFWLGATLSGAQAGDTLPSFLFSDSTDEALTIPPCEQWITRFGESLHMPVTNLGWWDARLIGSCATCGIDSVIACSAGEPALDCANATPIVCSASGITLAGETTFGESANVQHYCCAPWLEAGPEKVYRVVVGEAGNLVATLNNIGGGNADVFILSACDAQACVAADDSSVSATGLTAGNYYVVVDGRDSGAVSYDLTISCFGNCTGAFCIEDFNFGHPSNSRYYDGEYEASDGRLHWSYYAGWGSRQTIARVDPVTCSQLDTLGWTSTDASACRALAFDPRNGGQYWTGTITNNGTGTGRLYLISNLGVVTQEFSSIPGMLSLRWAGMAFDSDHHHLWVFTRAATNIGADTAYCLDVTNSAVPVLIQGPHALTHPIPGSILSAGGADYSAQADRILIGAQGVPQDIVECYRDIDPAYSGPPPGPGLEFVTFCVPDSNSSAGFGVAAVENLSASGEIWMTDFSDAPEFPFPHSVRRYPAPCTLLPSPCDSVSDLTCTRSADNIQLYWTATQAGSYAVYTTTDKSTTTDPPAFPWSLLASVELPANFPAVFVHENPIANPYLCYRIVVTCP